MVASDYIVESNVGSEGGVERGSGRAFAVPHSTVGNPQRGGVTNRSLMHQY
jgi:hypothetical protein